MYSEGISIRILDKKKESWEFYIYVVDTLVARCILSYIKGWMILASDRLYMHTFKKDEQNKIGLMEKELNFVWDLCFSHGIV